MNSQIRKTEEKIINQIEALRADIQAIQQPRSNFAIRHFVVGQHDMPGRQRAQTVLELQIKMFNIRRVQLEEKKFEIERRRQEKIVKEGQEFESELAVVELERIEVDLAEMNLTRMGAVREAECLLALLDELPAYTYEQLQEEEAQYWQARLSRQALQDMKAVGTIGQGNIEAIHQMFREVGEAGLALPLETMKAIVKISEE